MSRSVALDNTQPFFLKNLAAAYRAAGRMDEAAQTLREALVLAPDEPAIHEELGIVLDKVDRVEESVAEHRLALAKIARIGGPKSAQVGFEAKAQMNLGRTRSICFSRYSLQLAASFGSGVRLAGGRHFRMLQM